MKFTLLATLLATAASVSAGSTVLPGVLNLSPNILTSGNSLINLNVLSTVLPIFNSSFCSGRTSVLGVKTTASVAILNLNVASVCACVDVLNTSAKTGSACPACPAHASQLCASGKCGCQCNAGFFATVDSEGNQICAEKAVACASPNTLSAETNGKSTCICARGFVDDYAGGCISACLI